MAEKQVYTFNNEIDEVEVGSLGAKIIVQSYENDVITAEYENPSDKPELVAVLCGKRLTLKETPTLKIFSSKPTEGYQITVKLPKKTFKRLCINTASGGAELSDEDLSAEQLSLNTASGNIKICAFFENVKIKSASGSVELKNPTQNRAKSLKISAASGSVDVCGYKSECFSVSSVSGKTSVSGASGLGEIHVTSGTVDVNYSEWDNDLKISAVSGNVNVTLPQNSGADIRFDGVSGAVRTDLGNASGSFIHLGKGTNGSFGGDNRHALTVNLVSGTVSVTTANDEIQA